MTDLSETFELSVGEFNQLQQQIVNLKTELHELRMYKEQQETISKNQHRLRPLSVKKEKEPKVIADFDDPLSTNIRKSKDNRSDEESKKKIEELEKKISNFNSVKSKFEKEKESLEEEVKKMKKENKELGEKKKVFERENNGLINTLSKINLQHQDELKKRELVYEKKRNELEQSIETFRSDQESLVSSLREKSQKEKEDLKINSDASWSKRLESETLYLKKEIKQLNEKSGKTLSQEKKKLENQMKKNMKTQSEKFEKRLNQEKKKLESDLKKKHLQEMKNLGDKSDKRFESERKKYETEKKKIESFFQEKARKEVKACQTELNKRFDVERKKHVTQMQAQAERFEQKLSAERKKFGGEKEKLKKEIEAQKKEKNSHKKKNNEYASQVKQLNVMLENVRKDLSTSKEEVITLKSSEADKNKKIENLEHDRDDLTKEKNRLIHELEGKADIQKQIVEEKEALEKRLSSEKTKLSKSRKKCDKKQNEIEKLRGDIKDGKVKYQELAEKYDGDYVSMFVTNSLHSFHINHLSSVGESFENDLENIKLKNIELEEERTKNETEIRNLKNNVEDLQTENQIAQKHNIREIRDLKRHLSRYKSLNARLEKRLSSGGKSTHVRTLSSPTDPSRNTSFPRNRKTSGPDLGGSRSARPSPAPKKKKNGEKVKPPSNKTTTTSTPQLQKAPQPKPSPQVTRTQPQQQIKRNPPSALPPKKKKILGMKPSPKIRKKIVGGNVGNKGMKVSGDHDLKNQLRYYARRVKVLESQNVLYSEKLEQKTKIISDYMKREKLGRIHDHQVPKPSATPATKRISPHQHQQQQSSDDSKKGVLKLFSKKKKKKKKKNKNEAVDPLLMQKIMEETLVKNIQLQDNLKTMGVEVDRLLKENNKLRKTILKHQDKRLKEEEEEEEGEK